MSFTECVYCVPSTVLNTLSIFSHLLIQRLSVVIVLLTALTDKGKETHTKMLSNLPKIPQ